MKYFVTPDGEITGPVLIDNPENPLGLQIIDLDLPDHFTVCRVVEGKAEIDPELARTEQTATIETQRQRILADLASNDVESLRSTRALALAFAKGLKPAQSDIDKAGEHEAQAVALRAELATLGAA